MENPSLKHRRKADKTMRVALLILSITLATGVLLLIGVFLGMILPNPKTIEVYNQPLPVDRYEYHRGDPVSYELEYHKFTDAVAIVGRQMTCEPTTNDKGKLVQYVYTGMQSLSGLQTTPEDVKSITLKVTAFNIPSDAPFNLDCKINLIFKYEFNPLNVRYTRASTQVFRVVPANVPRRQSNPIKSSEPAQNNTQTPGPGTTPSPVDQNPPTSNQSPASQDNTINIPIDLDTHLTLPRIKPPGVEVPQTGTAKDVRQCATKILGIICL